MSERIYHKLVRDNIPEIIEQQGEFPVFRVLDQSDCLRCLNDKLREEVAEYLQEKDIAELCDILEVTYAIAQERGISIEDLEMMRLKKAETNGGFNKRIFLEKVRR